MINIQDEIIDNCESHPPELTDSSEIQRLLIWKPKVSWSVCLSAECRGPISLLRLRGSTETVHVQMVDHTEPVWSSTKTLHHYLHTPV